MLFSEAKGLFICIYIGLRVNACIVNETFPSRKPFGIVVFVITWTENAMYIEIGIVDKHVRETRADTHLARCDIPGGCFVQ